MQPITPKTTSGAVGYSLRFTITHDATHDFDLALEVSVGHHLNAADYRVGWDSAEEWRVSFSAPHQTGTEGSELSCEAFQQIYQKFAEFREQMKRDTEDTRGSGL